MTVLIVPDAMAPDLRRYVANNGRISTTHAGQTAAAPSHPEAPNSDHDQENLTRPRSTLILALHLRNLR